jgi:hypothetical protein
MKKKTIEDAQAVALEKGGKCLSTEYINAKFKLTWECDQEHQWEAMYDTVQRGSWCPKCSLIKKQKKRKEKSKKYFSYIKEICKEKGGECLSDSYLNNHTKLSFKCGKGHIWDTTASQINAGVWCCECKGIITITIQHAKDLAYAKNGQCLSDHYINARTPLLWRCHNGHEWLASYDRVRRGRWCHECYKENKAIYIKDAYYLAKSKGGKIITSHNGKINWHTYITWQCNLGHTWRSKYRHVKGGKWCPQCCSGISEKICRFIFEETFNRNFIKCRPRWLVNEEGNRLELDGYCEKLNLAFEHNGVQHYNNVKYFKNGNATLKRIQRHDQVKAKLCHERGITLIIIPPLFDVIKLHDLKSFIKNSLVNFGIEVPSRIDKIDINQAYIKVNHDRKFIKNKGFIELRKSKLEALNKIALCRDGKILSKEYLDEASHLDCMCKRNHTFKMLPPNIRAGRWCIKCAHLDKKKVKSKYSIDDINKIAKKHGCVSLDLNYINMQTSMRWQCNCGRQWKSTVNNMKTRSIWCLYCNGKKKAEEYLESIKELAFKNNCRVLSEEYINAKTKIKFTCCVCKNEWESTIGNIKHFDIWCPVCRKLSKARNKNKSQVDKNANDE